MNLLASPFIEIAKDRKTAQGIFMTLGAKTRLNLKGKPQDGGAGLGMYAADFINEDGVWKLWHRVDYPGFDGPLFGTPDGLEPIEESFEEFRKAFPVMPPTKAAHDACNTRTIRMDFDESKQYPFSVSRPAPHMPKPYDTWSEEQSYEPFVGHDVYNGDGSVRVKCMESELLQRAAAFSGTAVVVIHREGGEGADHEKGDERLSEGEAGILSWCTANQEKIIVILACNSVIDGDFLVEDTEYPFYMYTYTGWRSAKASGQYHPSQKGDPGQLHTGSQSGHNISRPGPDLPCPFQGHQALPRPVK